MSFLHARYIPVEVATDMLTQGGPSVFGCSVMPIIPPVAIPHVRPYTIP